jgi:tetratricopeptide (TPR) repeat protein
VSAAYADMIANPSKYSDLQLFQAGITASRAGRDADADKLFNAGLSINPYFRDAIYYVAAGYFNAKNSDKLFPLARRLVDLDPNNGDNWKLLAGAYQLRANGEKAQVARKADVDSTLKYFNKGKELPAQLRVTKFAKDGDKVTVAGTVENKGTAPKSYTIKFQMIDKTGQPVTSQDVPVQVAAGQTQPFDFTVTQPGVAAYKYAPLE